MLQLTSTVQPIQYILWMKHTGVCRCTWSCVVSKHSVCSDLICLCCLIRAEHFWICICDMFDSLGFTCECDGRLQASLIFQLLRCDLLKASAGESKLLWILLVKQCVQYWEDDSALNWFFWFKCSCRTKWTLRVTARQRFAHVVELQLSPFTFTSCCLNQKAFIVVNP